MTESVHDFTGRLDIMLEALTDGEWEDSFVKMDKMQAELLSKVQAPNGYRFIKADEMISPTLGDLYYDADSWILFETELFEGDWEELRRAVRNGLFLMIRLKN